MKHCLVVCYASSIDPTDVRVLRSTVGIYGRKKMVSSHLRQCGIPIHYVESLMYSLSVPQDTHAVPGQAMEII